MTSHIENNNPQNNLRAELYRAAYGKFNVKILCDNDEMREELLMDKDLITRIYVLTMKNSKWSQFEEIREVNEAIHNGEAIDSAFRSRGFDIQKKVVDVYMIKLPLWLQLAFETNSKRAQVITREFIVKKQEMTCDYATLTEIFSPDFKNPGVA